MLKWIYFGFVLLGTIPSWSQTETNTSGATPAANDQEQMTVPPPVSSTPYVNSVGSEMRSNYVRYGLSVSTAYIDNFYPGTGTLHPVHETTYSIYPMITLDQTTPRQHRELTYSPGFTLYQPTSTLDEVDQGAELRYRFRLTPYTAIDVNDSFRKSSNTFADGTVFGSLPNMAPGIIPPFAASLSNSANAQYSWQFSQSAMLGISGSDMVLNYSNASQAIGLYNSNERGASAFYNHRISAKQYAGTSYQYAWVNADPVQPQDEIQPGSVTQTHAAYLFYSIYPTHELSISVSGGIQHYQIAETSAPAASGWAPTIMSSLGWQVLHTSIFADYSREVSGGGGLLGASIFTRADASVRRQVSKAWIAGLNANYAINKSVTPLLFDIQQGHTLSGSVTVEYMFNAGLSLNVEYDRMHQSYGGIEAISNNPDSDRVAVSLQWQLMRPLGR